MMKRAVIVLNTAVLLIVFSFYGCSIAEQTNNDLESFSSTEPTKHIVEMTGDYEFVPSSLTIKQGDSVKWVVTGNKPHEVASGPVIETEDGREGVSDGLWKTGKMTSGSFTYTFHYTGTFPYYCDSHIDVGMIGTITVK